MIEQDVKPDQGAEASLLLQELGDDRRYTRHETRPTSRRTRRGLVIVSAQPGGREPLRWVGDRVLGGDQLDLAGAGLDRLLQDREDRGGHPLECGLGRAGAQQVGEEDRGSHVATAVRRDRQQRRTAGPRSLVGDRDDVDRAFGGLVGEDAGDEHRRGAVRADPVDRIEYVGHGARLPAGEEVELEVVGRDHVRRRDDVVAHHLGDARAARTCPGPRRPSPGRSSRPPRGSAP